MKGPQFNEEDLREIMSQGITPSKVSEQIERFKKGFPFINLLRPCSIGDGIHTLVEKDLERLEKVHSKAASEGRIMKFVPASGAASRMFKLLLSIKNRFEKVEKNEILKEAEKGDPDSESILPCLHDMRRR